MHIPDGFLDAKTAAAAAAISAVGVGVAVRRLQQTLPSNRVPLLGLGAAFIFAAQMLNFPVVGGTSGHLIGAVLAAVLLGPHAAILIMTTVLVLQCFLFADGGLTALGANVFNMAVLAPLVGFAIYSALLRITGTSLRSRLFATAIAAMLSTVAAAVSCAGQLALSGTVQWRVSFAAMTNVHMLIGFGEAIITMLVLASVARMRPDLFPGTPEAARPHRYRSVVAYGFALSAGLAFFVAPFASPWPDGLERVAAQLGFENRAAESVLPSPLPDYTVPGLGSPTATAVIIGLVGLLAAFAVTYGVARALTAHDRTV